MTKRTIESMGEDLERYEVRAAVTAWVLAEDEADAIATLEAGLDRLAEAYMDDGTEILWASVTHDSEQRETKVRLLADDEE